MIAAIVLSALSLVFSLVIFFVFDGRIKRQETLLNDFKIKEYREAMREKLQANLSVSTSWRDKNTLYLVIKNNGPSNAYNITIKNLDKDIFLFRNIADFLPIEIIPSGDIEQVELSIHSDMPEKALVQVIWEDDSKEKHTKKFSLSFS